MVASPVGDNKLFHTPLPPPLADIEQTLTCTLHPITTIITIIITRILPDLLMHKDPCDSSNNHPTPPIH
ncbi:hypothetical protein Ciccas_012312, partial [Cichlidogyrus casuarinus]